MGSQTAFGQLDISYTRQDYQDALAGIHGNDIDKMSSRKLRVLVDDVLRGERDHVAFSTDLQGVYDRVIDYVDVDTRGP